jgi:hypothetical protein
LELRLFLRVKMYSAPTIDWAVTNGVYHGDANRRTLVYATIAANKWTANRRKQGKPFNR